MGLNNYWPQCVWLDCFFKEKPQGATTDTIVIVMNSEGQLSKQNFHCGVRLDELPSTLGANALNTTHIVVLTRVGMDL